MKKGREKFKLHSKRVVFLLAAIVSVGLVLSAVSALNFSFSGWKNSSFNPVKKAQAQTTSLYLTNVHVSALTSTAATLAWETNLLSDSRVKIGTTASYEMTCGTCYSDARAKTHRIAIGGLAAGTTYHFQVISKTESGEEKASLDRTFVTPQPSNDTVAPSVTKLQVEALQTSAFVYITTTEEAHVIVAYAASSQPNFDATPDKADDIALPFRVDHTITLTGLTSSTDYFYRVRVLDQSNNSLTSGEFTFTTSGGIDHVFSTGSCGTVAIGECSNDGYYCDVGTATLVINCLHCGYRCPAGQSCQAGGVCTNDPSLSGDPYQCNRTDCYRSCSGDGTLSCASNQECQAAGAGTCIDDGVFNNPALSGCFSTYPRCDANVILKVKKDRECAKWLTCGTAIEQVDPKTNQSEELCLNLTACTSLSQSNQCDNYVDLPQTEITPRTPEEIGQIKLLSGSVTAGLDWQYQEGSPVIKGYYPWSSMEEVGEKLKIDNYNFEDTYSEEIDVNSDGTFELIKSYDISHWPNFTKYPDTADNVTSFTSVWDPETISQKNNRVLKVEGMSALNQGVRVQVTGSTSPTSKYVLSIKVKSDNSDPQQLTFALNSGGTAPVISVLGTYSLNSHWQTITIPPADGVGGAYTYLDIYVAEGNLQTFYLDEIKIQPVLEVGAGVFLNRSCRLYPQEDSPSCEYYDSNGIYQRGWKGYCLQRDPKNESLCLSWWPVDILYGESNLFGVEETAGYTGRMPLYYCLESEGLARLTGPKYTGVTLTNPYSPATINDYKLSTNCYPTAADLCSESCDQAGHPNDFCRKQFMHNSQSNNNASDTYSFRFVTPNLQRPTGFSNINDQTWMTQGWAAANDNYIRKLFLENNIQKVVMSAQLIFTNAVHNYSITLDRANNWTGLVISGGAGGTSQTCEEDELEALYHDWGDSATPSHGYDCLANQTWASCCGGGSGWLGGVQLKFNATSGLFEGYHYGLDWDLGGTNEQELYIRSLTFYLREPCNKIVEVVDSGGNDMAWADTINSASYSVPDLNYRLNTDLTPFGGAVVAGGSPENWVSPLFAEEANPTDYPSLPNQERSGKPYACFGGCYRRFCWGGNNDGQACLAHGDCIDPAAATPVQGVCMGVGVCALGKTECWTNGDCDAQADDYCIGGAASNNRRQYSNVCTGLGQCFGTLSCINLHTGVSTDVVDCSACNLNTNICTEINPEQLGLMRLRGLFAKSFNVYEFKGDFDPGEGVYNLSVVDPNWVPPRRVCATDPRPRYDPSNDSTFCGLPPKIFNIGLGRGGADTVNLGAGGGLVRLSFNTRVDSQQQPLGNIWVDWGDGGTPYMLPALYKAKDDPANPHIYTHRYTAGSCPSPNGCLIRIAIQDNWGWCSNWPELGTGSSGVCTIGAATGQPCSVITATENCPAGGVWWWGCNQAVPYTCNMLRTDRWDPLAPNACRGGSCQDGTCSGGLDAGRPCGYLTVELTND